MDDDDDADDAYDDDVDDDGDDIRAGTARSLREWCVEEQDATDYVYFPPFLGGAPCKARLMESPFGSLHSEPD
eukprot:5724300-Amphidinium_carterae.4